jgi:hypothetical protein
VKFIVVVREVGRTKPEYSLEFEAPEVPAVGSYLSIARPDTEYHTEDLIVRHVWWRLHHPETGPSESTPPKVGSVVDIQVECDQALGPHSRDQWRSTLEAARERGVEIEEFNLSRFSVSQAQMGEM